MKREIARAEAVIPAGVSSPLRACRQVGSGPLIVAEAAGETLWDTDSRTYIDFLYGFGPLILGHAPPTVTAAICEQAQKGCVFATMSLAEVELAEAITGTAAFLDQIRFVCSGTEAVMSAVRLARAFTGRTRVLRFRGGYHGHFDLAQNKVDRDASAAGLDPAAMSANIIVDYNDVDAVGEAFARCDREIAAVLVEPIACNMSLVPPEPGFLEALRTLCDSRETLLVFDEVITGFRFGFGPVSNLLGVEPDLCAFGKVIGGGTPVGAFGGRHEIMCLLDSEQVFQAGTFAANPLTMQAGLATLERLAEPNFYVELERKGQILDQAITKRRDALGLDFIFARKGSVFAFMFLPRGTRVRCQEDVAQQSPEDYARFYARAREAGYHLAPDVQEVMFVSAATADETLTSFSRTACEIIAAGAEEQ